MKLYIFILFDILSKLLYKSTNIIRNFYLKYSSVGYFIRKKVYYGTGIQLHGYSTFQIGKAAQVQIGNNVFIGTRSIICKGITIGDRSIIAAGSVGVKDIPADEVWGGNPAKFIKHI